MSHQTTPFGTRGCGRRLSLNRVENGGQLTPSQETVVLGFIGHAEFPTISGSDYQTKSDGFVAPSLLPAEAELAA